jgi:glycosyltransferase involved in cell wall biosynthesis
LSTTTRYSKLERSEPVLARPHNVNSSTSSARVILAIKNFAKIPGVCHIGLGVTAINTIKVLRKNGINAEAWSAQTYAELNERLAKEFANPLAIPITQVIVSAPSWIQPNQFGELCLHYPNTEFVQLNHSGTAYLSIDKFGIRNMREVIDLEMNTHNMRTAANNPRLAKWLSDSFGFQCLLLPNLYDTDSFVNPVPNRILGDTVRIGSFGAGRPWKNQLTAAEAAVQLARRLGMNLELYVNTMRPDGGERMVESRKELFHNLAGCKLIEVPWSPWPKFRDIAARMHVLFQPSFDETFNVVTADGIAEGVPSVSSPSIEWTPDNWHCKPEDPYSMVQIAIALLYDQHAVVEARLKLTNFVLQGLGNWLDYILHRPPMPL